MEKHVDVFGIMILMLIYDKLFCFFDEAVLVLLNIEISVFCNCRQFYVCLL